MLADRISIARSNLEPRDGNQSVRGPNQGGDGDNHSKRDESQRSSPRKRSFASEEGGEDSKSNQTAG